MVSAMTALDRKLWRDLWLLRGQAVAIALVMASGVACFIMFLSTVDSLLLSRELYYRDYRFAEIFAPLKRAPESVSSRIAKIEKIASIAPAAPNRCPVADFVDDIVTFPRWLPINRVTAPSSISSPSGVDVPCAFT